jgi:hypothetical protein
MSSKGMSTTAARTLIEECSRQNVKVLCLHDFDVSGFTICAISSRDTRRYEFERTPDVIDMGLRLSDVRKLNLQSEDVEIKDDPTDRLIRDGATPAEIEFLRGTEIIRHEKSHFKGRRVELNAMTNPQLVAFVERKLKEHGVKKVVPEESVLQREFRATVRAQRVQNRMEIVENEVNKEMEHFKPPKGLLGKVVTELARRPQGSWKSAIFTLANRVAMRKD